MARQLASTAGNEILRQLGDRDYLKRMSDAELRKLFISTLQIAIGQPLRIKAARSDAHISVAVPEADVNACSGLRSNMFMPGSGP